MKILLIEDDTVLRENIAQMLIIEGYEIAECATGDEGLYYISENTCDLVILDRMLPEIDGLSILRTVRKKGIKTPILMLTALNAVGDKVDGLDAGADDYLVKPFDMRELLARVRALVRRPAEFEEIQEFEFGDITYVLSGHLLVGPSGETHLPNRLASLLELFLRNTAPAINRTVIFNRVWGPDADVDDSIIDVYISHLRRRLKSVGSSVQVINNRGVGYNLKG